MPDLISIKRAEGCHPAIVSKILAWLVNCSTRNIGVRITDGFRTFAEQDILFEKGRTTAGRIVTNARGGKSRHNYGLAFDFCLYRENKTVSWDRMEDLDKDGIADWEEAVEEAKKLGFEWGGDWSSDLCDYPHFQMTFGLSIPECKRRTDAGLVDKNGFIYINKGTE